MSVLAEAEQSIAKANSALGTDDLSALTLFETRIHQDHCYMAATSALLFGCMSFEGFLNYYGVRRLGEDFYQRNIERLGITEKLSVVVLSCQGKVLEPSCTLLRTARSLFDSRNRLVHPKAREMRGLDNIREYISVHPRDIGIHEEMEKLKCIVNEFCLSDPEIIPAVEFPNPSDTQSVPALFGQADG